MSLRKLVFVISIPAVPAYNFSLPEIPQHSRLQHILKVVVA